MDKLETISLMESSGSEREWNDNCDRVVAAHGGYPSFWYEEIVSSGLIQQVANKWGGDASIHIGIIRADLG